MKNILLTGSGGFIGLHVKNFLSEKFNLFTPRSFQLNLLDQKAVSNYVKENDIELIIHSASCGVRITPDATIDDVAKPNFDMFKNLADCVNENCPMITFGSGAEYDKSRPLIKVKEEDFGKSIPKDPYGYSKYLISKEIEKCENILNLRIFGIYGLYEDKSRVTSCIVNDNLAHRPILLNQNVIFDFIWIEDFCKIVEFFINNPTKEKFINVTPTESIEIVELAKIENRFSDFKSEIIIKKEGLNKEYTGDNSKLCNLMPELKFTSYEEGMKKFYSLMKNQTQVL